MPSSRRSNSRINLTHISCTFFGGHMSSLRHPKSFCEIRQNDGDRAELSSEGVRIRKREIRTVRDDITRPRKSGRKPRKARQG